MYALRYTLLSFVFVLFGLNSSYSQVFGVDYLLEYSADSCAYVAKIIIVDGSATSTPDRTQLNSTYTIVIPEGSSLVVENSMAPFKGNIFGGATDGALTWGISNIEEGPPITPDLTYVSIIPDLSIASWFNDLAEGDTVSLFTFSVDPLPMCGEEIRLFENGSDPNSTEMPGGKDFSSGYVIGQDPDQDYLANREEVPPGPPEIEFTIDCSGDVTIVPDLIDSLICNDALPYTYEWTGPNGFYSTDEIPVIPDGTGAGEYCAYIVDGFGCDTTICKMLDVVEPEINNETVCGTDPYTLVNSTGLSGTWVFEATSNTSGAYIGTTSGGSAEVTFDSDATGEYIFEFESDGCASTTTLTIMPASSEPNVVQDGPKCEGEVTTLTADLISGATYEWSDISGVLGNDRELEVSSAGTYTLTMDVAGCPSTVDVIVTYTPTPVAPTLGVTMSVCVGDDVDFTASNITGASNSDYQWTQTIGAAGNSWNEQNPSINGVTQDDAGTYEVIVTIVGCPSTAVEIELIIEDKPSTPTIDAIDPVCEGDDIQFNTNASASTYTWTQSGGNGNVLTGQSPTISPATLGDAGTYTLVVEDGNCSSDPVDVVVVVNEKPADPIITATSPVCVGEPIEFTSNTISGAIYAWTGPNNFSTEDHTINMASLSDAGTYTLIVTVNGCESEPVTVDVVVNATAPAPNAAIQSPVCVGEDVDFTTDPVSGGVFTWTQVSGGSNVIVTSDENYTENDITSDYAGDWELEVDLNGCLSEVATATLVINDTPTTPAPTSNTDLCEGEELELFANVTADSYEWLFDGFFFSDQQNPVVTSITIADAGTYELIITNNNCPSEAGATLVVINAIPNTPPASSNSPVCENEDIELYTDFVPGATYTWTGPTGIEFTEQNPVISGASAIEGTYHLVVEVDGCESEEASTTIMTNPNPVQPSISSNGPLCTGMNLELYTNAVPGATYIWTGPNSFTSDEQNPFYENIPIEGDGMYTLVIEVAGCPSAPANLNVDIYETPEIPTADSNSPICVGGVIQLYGSSSESGVSYSWTGPGFTSSEQDPTITGADPDIHNGTYTLTVSLNGCESEEATVEIEVIELPEPDAGTYDDLCVDADPILLAGNPAGIYSGTGVNAAGDMFDPSDAGVGPHTLLLTVTDVNGCVVTSTTDITVHDLPAPDAGTYAAVCIDGGLVNLVGTPSGGTFTGDGVDSNNDTFDPIGLDGEIDITYTYTDANSCENFDITTITVNPLPTPDAGTYAAICEDNGIINLAGTPVGGIFSGTGVDATNETFDPTGLSGDIEITYTYTDANSCVASATTSITVNDVPTIDAGTYTSVCEDADNVALAGMPAGGTWSGDGVTGDEFDPSGLSGSVTLTYEFFDANNCGGTATATIEVFDLPTVDAGSYAALCADADVITLSGNVAGGTWSGDGVTGDQFDPTGLSGIIEITYTVTDANLCSNFSITTITVNDVPTIDAGTYSAVCEDANNVALTGIPAGGTWSGDGVSGDEFSPSGLSGDYTLTYEFFDANGCGGTATTTISVNDLPAVDAGTYAELCIDADPITLTGTPTGGTWTGDGVTGDEFNPTNVTAGSHTLTYTFSDANNCESIATTEIIVNPLPTVSAGDYNPVCIDGDNIDLVGNPTGGIFSGQGVTGDVFEPALAEEGTHTITYEYEDENGCTNTATTEILVNPLPTVDAGSYPAACANDNPIALVGTPANGLFSGDGVDGDFFVPSDVNPGTYTITYTYQDENDCTNTATSDIEVVELPVVEIAAVDDVCIDADPFELSGTPINGMWDGPGMTGSTFNPAAAGVGPHTISYIFEDAAGCSDIGTVEITVVDLPPAFAGDYDPICEEGSPVSLSGNPAGGTFTGTGVTSDGLFFDPFDSGTGTFTITYTVTENGCTNTATTEILVNELPSVDAGTWGPYCDYDGTVTLIGSPDGGDFSGDGVVNNTFNPEGAGPGEHTITYTYTDNNGCTNSTTTEITVNEKPTVEAGIYPDVCLDGGAFEIVGNPSGGTFSGTGVTSSGDMFDPSIAGEGTHRIDYFYEDANGCSDIASAEVTVIATPDTPQPASNSAVCEGETIELSTDEISGATYMWIGPDNFTASTANPFITDADPDLHSGTYEVKVTVEGCDSEWGSVDVVVNPTPETPEPTSNSGICAGETLVVSVEEVPNAMYDWSGPNGLVSTEREIVIPNAGIDQEGAYCLIITVNGCESEFACTDVIINPIPDAPVITTTAPVCIGTDISFGTETPADSYQWDYPDGTEFSTDQNPVLTGSTLDHNGQVSLVITVNGCVSEPAYIDVVVNELPTVSAGPFDDMCADDMPLTLVGSPENGTFSGQGVDGATFDPSVAGSGMHTLTYDYTDVNGCSASTTATITVNDMPTLELVSVDCSADLESYTITFSSSSVVTAGSETVTGNQVTNIDINNNVMLVATSPEGCIVELPISAPQCNCDEVMPAVSAGDQEVCFGMTNPSLTVSADAGVLVDWYSMPTGDNLIVANQMSYLPTNEDVGSYTFYAETRTEPDNCTSNTRTPVTLTIQGLPMITNTELNDEICSGDMSNGFELMSDQPGTIFDWTASVSDADGHTVSGSGNIPSEVLNTSGAQGTVTYTVTPTLDGCPGEPVDFVVTVNGLPEITIDNKECSIDLETYTIIYSSDFDVTSTAGDNSVAGQFTDIPKGETVTLTITNLTTGCTQDIPVTAPQCDCTEVAIPTDPVNQEICVGDDAESLSVTVDADIEVSWFSSPVAGSSLGTGLSYTPEDIAVGVYTYYAEARNTVTDCISEGRTEVTYTINSLPTLTVDSKECASDLESYTIVFTTDADVTVSEGSLSGNQVVVAANTNTILTIVDPNTGCETTMEVIAPNCDCSEVAVAISNGDEEICEGETTPELSVSIDAGLEATWYYNNVAVANNTTTFTSPENSVGEYSYFVETINPVDGCVSTSRTEVVLTINAMPSFTIEDKECSADLETYTVTFTTDGTVASSHGTVSGNQVVGITAEQAVVLTITNNDGCQIIENVTAPSCACDDINAPTGNGAEICFGDTNPTLTATADAGMTILWFDNDSQPLPSGNTVMTTETVAGSYTYYAQARNDADGCVSDQLAELVFTIIELPTITLDNTSCSADFTTYDITVVGTGTITSTEGTVNGNVIQGVSEGIDAIITIENANGCINTLEVSAPTCACDNVPMAISGGDQEICFGEANPTLTASVGAGFEIDWFDNDMNPLTTGTSVLTIETIPGVFTYYAEARNTADGCTSDQKTEVVFTINELPTLTLDNTLCSADFTSYDITVVGTGTITSTVGTVNGNVIEGVQEGIDAIITIEDANGCINTLEVTAPTCACDDVVAPISLGDQVICFDESNPTLEATTVAGTTISWFSTETGGTSIMNNSLTYTPSVTDAGIYTYYAEATNDLNGCVSDRIPVQLTINELPQISVDMKSCADDKLSYDVTITGDVTLTNVTGGVISGLMINGILADMNITVTFVDNATGCENSQLIEAPNCDCDEVTAPINTGDEEICFGEANPMLAVQSVAGITINWYSQSSGGDLLMSASDTYTPSVSSIGIHTFYPEAVNSSDGCMSNTRTPVTLTIHELPVAIAGNSEEVCAGGMNPLLTASTSAGSVIDWFDAQVGGTELATGQDSYQSLASTAGVHTVYAQARNITTGCTGQRVALELRINEQPTITSAGNQSVCVGESNPALEVVGQAGVTYNWYANQSDATAIMMDSESFTPSDANIGSYTYYVSGVDMSSGCESERIGVTLNITGAPMITNIDREDEICSGELSSGFEITSDMTNVTYAWTASIDNISGQVLSGSGNITPAILSTLTETSGSVIFSVIPSLNGCDGPAVEFIINVNASPDAGENKMVDCTIDSEINMTATGIGEWSMGNNNPGLVQLENASDPLTRVFNFEVDGVYEFVWTSNGCTDVMTITVGTDCPCEIEGNNLLDDVADTYCATTDVLMLTGDEALPLGGDYTWEVNINGQGYTSAQGVNNLRDYDASNLGNGDYSFRRLYTITTDNDVCSEASNEIDFLVFSDKSEPGEIMFTPNPVCQGDTLYLEVEDYNPELTYNWSVMSGNARFIYSLDSMSNLVVDSPGAITVSVTQSLDGCQEGLQSTASTLDIDVFANPQPMLGADTTFCELDATYFIHAGEFEEYLWQDGSDYPDFEVEGEGIYSVTVTDSLGCVGTDIIDIKSFCCEFAYPNIFKADSRGQNSEFKITDIYGCALTSKLHIFDRWGNKVYTGEDTTTWDGTYNGKSVAQGVYVFIFEYTAKNANREIFEERISGDITVIRDRY